MLDLLAAIQSADPPSLVLWSLFVFAAGMYPIGFMLGSSCSPCCSPCELCTEGSLPETLTVTLDGFPEYNNIYLTSLTFESCHGGGASGRVESPGHTTVDADPADDRGPITAISLTSGGSGYAKLGRTAPTVTVSGTSGSGTGATFDVTLESSQDSCGLDIWGVSAVTATGGVGYKVGDTLTFAVASGDKSEAAAVATISAVNYGEPTLTLTAPGGTGGVLTITGYAASEHSGYWAIDGVAVEGSGSGYTDNANVSVTLGNGDEARPNQDPPNIRIRTVRRPPNDWTVLRYGPPQLTLSVLFGTGATLTVTKYNTSASYPGFFEIGEVSVVSGGSGYFGDDVVYVSLGAGDEVAAEAFILRGLRGDESGAIEWADIYSPGAYRRIDGADTGGLVASLTLAPHPSAPGFWAVDGWTIVNGGIGYAVGTLLAFSATEGGNEELAVLEVAAVDANGAVTELTIASGGRYAPVDTGVIESVELLDPGAYRKSISISAISVTNGGVYYREDASLPPYVATVTVGISQTAPSQGSGASLSATVDTNTGSATFGQITAVDIDDGGDGYLAHKVVPSCFWRFNGRSIVVKRGLPSSPCLYEFSCEWEMECGLERELVFVEYRGPSQPLRVELALWTATPNRVSGERLWDYGPIARLTADALSPDCSDIDVIAHGSQGLPATAEAHVTAGGEYQVETCRRITNEDLESLYVDVTWGELSVSGQSVYTFNGCGASSQIIFAAEEHRQSGPGTTENLTAAWCDQFKSTFEAEAGVPPASSLMWCYQSFNNVNLVSRIWLKRNCEWKWYNPGSGRDHFFFATVSRRLRASSPAGTFDVTRICYFAYPVLNIPTDEDLLPSGQVQIGNGTYTTELVGPSGSAPFSNAWLQPLIGEAAVCADPGPPTITFSRLP